jgi:hypothetical protein
MKIEIKEKNYMENSSLEKGALFVTVLNLIMKSIEVALI